MKYHYLDSLVYVIALSNEFKKKFKTKIKIRIFNFRLFTEFINIAVVLSQSCHSCESYYQKYFLSGFHEEIEILEAEKNKSQIASRKSAYDQNRVESELNSNLNACRNLYGPLET